MNKLSSSSAAGQGMTKVVDKVTNLNDSDDDFKSSGVSGQLGHLPPPLRPAVSLPPLLT